MNRRAHLAINLGLVWMVVAGPAAVALTKDKRDLLPVHS